MDFDFSHRFDLEQKAVDGFLLFDLSEAIEEQYVVPGEKRLFRSGCCLHDKSLVTLDIKPYYITKLL